MNLIIVADIFGKTPALEKLCSNLPGATRIIDPYDSVFMDFKNEEQAYKYFIKNTGMKKYTDTLCQAISSESDQLIGFSVGACAIWLLSEHEISQNISGAVCFYGSQIRDATDLFPKFPIKVILPKQEELFSVKELSSKLELKQNVKIHQSRYLHGFMNVYSKNYNQTAYNHYLQWLCNMD